MGNFPAARSMGDKPSISSEAEELEAFLKELEAGGQVKEIAGWESGFPNLSRSLNGILPGLCLLIGPPSSGKSTLAKQLCDQVAFSNSVPAIFFAFAETKKDLRVRTLARMSGLESREIRRGSPYLLHWYGVPKPRTTDPEGMAPSWERLLRAAAEARDWLDLVYIFEGSEKTDLKEMEERIRAVEKLKGSERAMVVVDDCHYLAASEQSFDGRLPLAAAMLQQMAVSLKAPVLATWTDLRSGHDRESPQAWAERVPGAEVILVLEEEEERTKKLIQPNRAMTLHIVKNRGGETGKVAFDFSPPFSKFVEANLDSK